MSRLGPGPFVYSGSGRKSPEGADLCQRKCKIEACGIQYCLQRNNHVQAKCDEIIAVYKTCCENAKAIEQEQLQEQAKATAKAAK